MNVTSYLSLYTTILGWQQYQNLWDIMTGTGLVYLPFVSIILMSTVKPFLSMGAKDFAVIAVRRLIIQILTALLVIAVCAVPSMNMDTKVLHYSAPCQSGNAATVGNTGTTYDASFSNLPTGVKIPLFWYLVMSVSNGFTYAATEGLSCSPIDYRALHTTLDTTTIQDSSLKQQVGNFYNQCYVPAYDHYLNGNLSDSTKFDIDSIQKQYGKDDVSWLGSQTFLQAPGFYDALQANSPVPGFAFNPTRDLTDAQIQNHSQWGEPDCKTWWTDSTNGLHAKLMQQFPPSFMQSLLSMGSNAPALEDASIRHLLQYSDWNKSLMASNTDMRGYESLSDQNNPLSTGVFDQLLGSAGIVYKSITGFTTIHLIVNALPVIQAAILFCLYTFLAIAMPFASFRPGFILTGAIVMFSVIFCSYIWQLIAWFDTHLMSALFPASSYLKIGADFFGLTQHGISEMFVNLIIGTLYVVAPVFFMVVMSWAGLQAGAVFGAILSPMSAPAVGSGQASGSAVQGAASLMAK